MSNFTLSNFSFKWLAQRPYIIAVVITLVLVLWMVSGMSNHSSANTDQIQNTKKTEKIIPLAKVKVELLYAQRIFNVVELYGRTEPNRIVTLKSEVRGKITAVLAKRGSKVTKGQVIVKVDLNNLNAQLTRSKALLKQRQIEFNGTQKLAKKGYQGDVQLAKAHADLEAVKADIQRLELDIKHTVITAPFDGILNTRYVEEGDYVASGDNIAMIVDLNPIVVRAYATEQQVSSLHVGQQANITLLHKQTAHGQVRYISSVADDATNTFKVEVSIENKNSHFLAGLSSELSIPLEEINAIKVSPALLALDEQGNVGVKTVVNSKVIFTPIDIVKSDPDGIWLTGLGEQVNLITLGQGFVRAGDSVEAVFSDHLKPNSRDKPTEFMNH